MARSDSSDDEYERRHKKKRKERRRTRSRSLSSDRPTNKRSYKSSRDRKRSRSRSRSHSRDRTRRSRYRSRSRSRERASRRHRSHSRDRNSRSRNYSDDESNHKSKIRNEKLKTDIKEDIEQLNIAEETYKPSEEQLSRIENEGFVQEHFSKTYNQSNPPQQQQGKKKKKKKKQQLQTKQPDVTKNDTAIDGTNELKICHDDVIFGTASDTMYLSKFSSRIDTKRKEQLKNLQDAETNEDLIFGAMFCEKPEVRMKRWLEKLQIIRTRLRVEQPK